MFLDAKIYGTNQRGLLARSDGEISWDFPCEPQSDAVRILDSEDVGGEDCRTKKSKTNSKNSWVRPKNGFINLFKQFIYYIFVYRHQ